MLCASISLAIAQFGLAVAASAAGTFLAAVAAGIAVSSIILGEITRSASAATVLSGWAAGASMQIAAGIVSRLRADGSAN
jgi:hypothetical protein